MIRRRIAALLVCTLVSALCAGAGVLPPVQDYYYGEDGAIAAIPAVTGTFIQPWLCEDWTDAQWDGHLDMLLSAGIDTVILQWTAETSNGVFSYAGFPLPDGLPKADSIKNDATMVERLLKSAQSKHVKVFLGLNTAQEWWNNAFLQRDWCAKQAEAGNRIAAQLYALYKSRYPDAFYGWYWAWEMYGNLSGYEKPWSDLMNVNLDFLSKLDSSMPLLFSPFLSGYIRLTPSQEEAMWTGLFKSTRLRAGDIFCPQDSAGAAGFAMKYIDEHLAAMKRAAGTKAGLLFWVNNENFTKDYKPAPLDRFISQLYVSARYTDTHMCFSYSHYYNPDLVNPSFDQAYKKYLKTGRVDKVPPAPPQLKAEASGEGLITLRVTPADASDCYAIKLYRGNRLIATHEVTDAASASGGYSMEDKLRKGVQQEYFATVTDCWGNVSGMAKVIVDH